MKFYIDEVEVFSEKDFIAKVPEALGICVIYGDTFPVIMEKDEFLKRYESGEFETNEDFDDLTEQHSSLNFDDIIELYTDEKLMNKCKKDVAEHYKESEKDELEQKETDNVRINKRKKR